MSSQPSKFLSGHKNVAPLGAALFLAVFILISINLPRMAGVANNGDFVRVTKQNGIAFVGGNPNIYTKFQPDYVMEGLNSGSFVKRLYYLLLTDYSQFDYVSSQTVVIKISKILNAANNVLTGKPLESYNIFWLGLTYVVIFAIAAYFILKFIYNKFGFYIFLFTFVAFLFVLCDHGKVLYFNSFFGEPLTYVSFLLAIGLFLRLLEKDERRPRDYVLYFAAVIFMSTAKNADMPTGLLFAMLPLVFIRKGSITRTVLPVAATAVFLMAFTALCTPRWIDDDTNFGSVFSGVLRNSATPEKDLEELGLSPEYAVLQGFEWYLDDYPVDVHSTEFRENFFDKVSKTKILVFYIKHPVRFMKTINTSADFSAWSRPRYLTNSQNPAEPGEQLYRFSLWEKLREASRIYKLPAIAVVFLISAALTVYDFIKNKRKVTGLMALFAAILFGGAYNLAIPYVGNGVGDLAKHMFAFTVYYDIMLIILLGAAAHRLPAFIKAKVIPDKG